MRHSEEEELSAGTRSNGLAGRRICARDPTLRGAFNYSGDSKECDTRDRQKVWFCLMFTTAEPWFCQAQWRVNMGRLLHYERHSHGAI
jgi:hypothetical protein